MQDGNGESCHDIAEEILLQIVLREPSENRRLIQRQIGGPLPVASARLGRLIAEALPSGADFARVGAASRLGGVECLLRVDGARDQETVVVRAAWWSLRLVDRHDFSASSHGSERLPFDSLNKS